MKLLIILLSVSCIVNTNKSFAFAVSRPYNSEKPLTLRLANNIRASEFIKLSAEQFTLTTGKKLNLLNRISFSLLKMKIKHDLKKNPNLTIADYYLKNASHSSFPRSTLGIIIIAILAVI